MIAPMNPLSAVDEAGIPVCQHDRRDHDAGERAGAARDREHEDASAARH